MQRLLVQILFVFFVFDPILMKLGEVVVLLDTTTSPSFIKIGLKTKKFSHEPISGTFECGVNNRTVEVHHQTVSLA